MGRLTYQTLHENVVDVICMKILNHELTSGMRIIEQDTSDEFGVSRGPIRETLRQLEQEGLMEYVGNVGCPVRNITLEDIYEIYLLRATYEILAVKLCRGVLSEAVFAETDAALESMRDLKDTDYSKPIARDNTLHKAVIRSTGLPWLIEGWTGLNYRNATNYYADNSDSRAMIDHQYPIHRGLVDVYRTGNTEDIRRVISNHYTKTIRRRLKEQGMPEDHFKFSIDVIDGWV